MARAFGGGGGRVKGRDENMIWDSDAQLCFRFMIDNWKGAGGGGECWGGAVLLILDWWAESACK